jgi:small conductance mechanosensitive channel
LALVLLATAAIPKIIDRSIERSRGDQTEEEVRKRSDTLSGVLVASLQAVILAVVAFMMLDKMGLNIAPVIAGVGVVGIAIGFGAQSLVKDIISGLFILLENQYRKGDVVKIADATGLVEDINLRRTILRDTDGVVHSVPNGEIKVASNLTKGWSRVNLNVGVDYGTDLDKAIEVINRVGKELAEDPAWSAQILKPPQVLRVDNLGDSAIDIKILGDTKPMQQWAVTGELRLRLKKAFDKENIEIPWPITKVYFGNAPEIPAPQSQKKKD